MSSTNDNPPTKRPDSKDSNYGNSASDSDASNDGSRRFHEEAGLGSLNDKKKTENKSVNTKEYPNKDDKSSQDIPELSETKREHNSPRQLTTCYTQLGITDLISTTVSTYIPNSYNYTILTKAITDMLWNYAPVHELKSNFSGSLLMAYFEILFIVQILRAKKASSKVPISKEENRVLSMLTELSSFEGWSVPGPIADLLSSLGLINTNDESCPAICPVLPTFTGTHDGITASELNSIVGLGRIPFIPATLERLSDAGRNEQLRDNEIVYSHDAQSEVGQILKDFNGIFELYETTKVSNISATQKLNALRRYGIKHQTKPLSSLTAFLGLDPDSGNTWVINLIEHGAIAAKFFNGSTTLDKIPVTTPIHEVTYFELIDSPSDFAQGYFNPPSVKTINFKGYSMDEQDKVLTRMAACHLYNSDYVGTLKGKTPFNANRSGPFFKGEDGNGTPFPFKTEAIKQMNPSIRFGIDLQRSFNAS